MRAALSLIPLLLAATPAFPMGGFSCFADDDVAKFEVGAGVTRGLGGPAFNFHGDLKILSKTVTEAFRKTTFEARNLVQYWFDERELRLLAFQDRPTGSVELQVRTQVSEESVYGGQFELTIFEGNVGEDIKQKGPVTCWVD